MPPSKNSVAAVRTSLRLVEALRRKEGAGVTELANELGVSKGTVHNHLSTLRDEDFVVKSGDVYHLGFRFLDIAHYVKRRVSIYDLVAKEVDQLAEKSGEMALYSVEEHGLAVCLYRALGDEAVQTPLYVGQRDTLHHTAVGKSILAHLPEERVREIIDEHGLERRTENTITEEDELLAQLEEIRDRGFAYNEEETIPGLVGIGAPVKNQDGELAGAISIIGPTSRLDHEDRYEELGEMITRSVNIIEINATSI